jgi:hypothetical protein
MRAAQRPRSLRRVFSRHWKKITVVALIELFLILLAVWTAYSPTILSAQSQSDISNSLFQFAKTTEVVNTSDAAGSYSFLFGMDYNSTFTSGAPTIVEVFASLTAAQISSSFTKGVGLQIDEARVLIDGAQDAGVQERVTNGKNVTIDYLSYVQANVASGTRALSVRLIASVVDVNYIGYVSGNQFLVTLNGTFSEV